MKEDKTIIKQFSDGSSFWWVGYKCYHLNEKNDIVFICGGNEDPKETELIRDFCKRNKKTYKQRAGSNLDK